MTPLQTSIVAILVACIASLPGFAFVLPDVRLLCSPHAYALPLVPGLIAGAVLCVHSTESISSVQFNGWRLFCAALWGATVPFIAAFSAIVTFGLGWYPSIYIVALPTWLALRSMVRQLRKVDAERDEERRQAESEWSNTAKPLSDGRGFD